MNFGLFDMIRPFFSIIIPTFNSSLFILDALKSVLSQTFIGFELIIVDGCSSDNTVNIATSLNDPRIRILCEPDKGVYDAMNKGILASRGEWLYFMGSDDRLFSFDVLQKIFSFVSTSNVHVLYGNVISSRFDGVYDGEFTSDKLLNKNICHQAIFFKRHVFLVLGCFDLHFKVLSDWDFNIKWFFDERICKQYVDLIIAYYADGGLSSVNLDKSFFFLKEWIYRKVQKSNYSFRERFLFFINLLIELKRQRRHFDLLKILLEFPAFLV